MKNDTENAEIVMLRKRTGMNQTQFAKLVGIHQQAYFRYESGSVAISLNRFRVWEVIVQEYLDML